MRFVGIVLMLFGALALGYQGFAYGAGADPNPAEGRAERERRVWVPPVVGGVAVAAGFVLVAAGRRPDPDPGGSGA